MREPLGLIAGKGKLPRLLIQACQSEERPVFVLAYKNQTDPETAEGIPHIWLSIGEMGKAFDFLKKNGVVDVVLAGGFQRPSLKTLKTDWRGALFLARLSTSLLGDNSLLIKLTEELEKEGLRVVSSQSILSFLQKPAGPLGSISPDVSALKDIYFGIDTLNATSALDIGQAVVVQQGLILGLEAVEGTDNLIQRCGPLQKEGPAGILVKMAKRNQSDLVDLPVIGPQTLKNVIHAGLRGIAFEAHKALVIDTDFLQKEADRAGIFVIALKNLDDF